MKKIYLLALVLFSSLIYSQTKGITYQAVILNPEGEHIPGYNNERAPLTNTAICLRFSIYKGTILEYQESKNTTTDEFGMVNVIIGSGVYIGGTSTTLSGVDWDGNAKNLVVEVDVKGTCSNFIEISDQPFTYVPYAFYAENSGTPGPAGPQGPAGPTGATGAQGPQGVAGATGAQGATGPQGATGLQGTTGPVGPAGPQGLAGATGADGASAYQVAVSNGYLGTQVQWLSSLVGAQGQQGQNGNGFTNGTLINQLMYWNGSIWTTLNPGTDGQVLTICGGNLGWVTVNGICGVSNGIISLLNCNSAITTGNLTQGIQTSGVSTSVSYTGGNGGIYTGQNVSSSGVTGLTAILASGTLVSGAGTLSYTIVGIPTSSGTASFVINVGGQSCTLNISVTANLASQYPVGSIFCASGPTAIVDVTNPSTGKIWMDRNLGATQPATSSIDAASYGDLYQWGRGSDGHQCRNSATTTTLSSTDQPGNGNFIIISSGGDWRSPNNNNLWQGINGINNPCPTGYRIPTEAELNIERLSWTSNDSSGAYNSPLKFTQSGIRGEATGDLSFVGNYGKYWTNTIYTVGGVFMSKPLYFNNSINSASIGANNRAGGFSVRCIKD